ncbi:MAG: hypothetical protein M1835_002993, partial [Candelina submexicana]
SPKGITKRSVQVSGTCATAAGNVQKNRRRSIILNVLEKSISVIVAANTLPSQNKSMIRIAADCGTVAVAAGNTRSNQRWSIAKYAKEKDISVTAVGNIQMCPGQSILNNVMETIGSAIDVVNAYEKKKESTILNAASGRALIVENSEFPRISG